jgi:rare lipoprotein A
MRKLHLSFGASCLLLLFLLAGCGGKPARVGDPSATARKPAVAQKRGGGYYKDDGPAANIPVDLDNIPDARPRLEPLRRAANKPYVALGKTYVPNTTLKPVRERGIASWYGKKFHGRKTSIGETYDMFAMTAAHPTLALPSYVRVTHLGNGKSVVVRVNDRGPFHAGRIIDLSYAAAHRLGYINEGSTRVEVEALLPTSPVPASPLYVAPSPPPTPTLPIRPPPAPPQNEKYEQLMTELALLEDEDGEEKTVEAVEVDAAKVAGERKGIFLQLGAFSNADNAENLRTRLASELDWLTEPIQIQHGEVYRVQLGPYSNRENAEKIAEEIRVASGYRPTIVVR